MSEETKRTDAPQPEPAEQPAPETDASETQAPENGAGGENRPDEAAVQALQAKLAVLFQDCYK